MARRFWLLLVVAALLGLTLADTPDIEMSAFQRPVMVSTAHHLDTNVPDDHHCCCCSAPVIHPDSTRMVMTVTAGAPADPTTIQLDAPAVTSTCSSSFAALTRRWHSAFL